MPLRDQHDVIYTYYVEEMEATANVHVTRERPDGTTYNVGARMILDEVLYGDPVEVAAPAQQRPSTPVRKPAADRATWGLTPDAIAAQKRAEAMFGGPAEEGG